jgi:3-oxoacyl-[acyl-carrier-protein] synthase-3
MSAGIVDLAAAETGRVVGNEHFESIGLTDEWIRRRTGISSRMWLDEDAPLAEVAAEACRPLVARMSDPTTVDVLIVVSTSARQRIPGIAQEVAALAGLPSSVMAYDMNAACCGFVYALASALSLCDARQARSVIVCSVEAMSRMVDKQDRQTACLFGDGAAAVLLEDREDFPPFRHVAGCDGSEGDLMHETEGRGIHLDGVRVYDRAVLRMSESAQHLADLDPAPTVLVGHQANGRILEQVRSYLVHLDIPFVNRISHFANTSSASIPLAFADELRAGKLTREGRLGGVAYGAGEAWGAISVSYRIPVASGSEHAAARQHADN